MSFIKKIYESLIKWMIFICAYNFFCAEKDSFPTKNILSDQYESLNHSLKHFVCLTLIMYELNATTVCWWAKIY